MNKKLEIYKSKKDLLEKEYQKEYKKLIKKEGYLMVTTMLMTFLTRKAVKKVFNEESELTYEDCCFIFDYNFIRMHR